MKSLAQLSLFLLLLSSLVWAAPQDDVAQVLDDFHLAASQADGERYFGHFAKGGVFIGTDMGERWSVAEFRAYAQPHFSQGRGWTYLPVSRHIDVAADGRTAWFDENLKNEKYGATRGSGVLVLEAGVWKLAQYHLTVPVPNELLLEVVEMIQKKEGNP